MGKSAPITIPATFASAKATKDLYKIFPDSTLGTNRISALAATSPPNFFCFLLSLLMALSNAKGPSTKQFLICPRLCMMDNKAASSVEGIFSLTISMADKAATLGSSTPIFLINFTALFTICTLCSKVGKMFKATSVMASNL